MGARFSSRFFTAEAKESPPTVATEVAATEAMLMVGTAAASTSGREEYYSERCEAMTRSRGQFADDVALDIAFSTSHCSEVSRLEVAPQSAEAEELNRSNREVLKQMEEQYPQLFRRDLARAHVLGRMIAKGGQAEIYEVVGHPDRLLKVFERGTSLRDLQRLWPLPILTGDVCHCIHRAGMLEDGRFAFSMVRCWGDLRKLIDQAMEEKNVGGIHNPPFPYKWKEHKTWTLYPVDFMLGIAVHMQELHEHGVSHRDLKASNILIQRDFGVGHGLLSKNVRAIVVADFECSIGVFGTGFWRAPEVLSTLGNHKTMTNEQWKQADVYSYGMTCFEIVTGRIPFDGELGNTKVDRQLVIEGKRPQLPSDLDDVVKELIVQCWEQDPTLRPTFSMIVKMVETISKRRCEFRLFDISDVLPQQYYLATVEEVNDFPLELKKAMPRSEIANLANGSVDGYLLGMVIRSRKLSNVHLKLARLHH